MQTTETTRTEANSVRVAVNPEGIPDVCKGFDHWVVHRNKMPFDARTGQRASTTNSRTWRPFPEALEAYKSGRWDGIGFVFSSGDPYTGIDLDNVRNAETGEIEEWAQLVIDGFPGAHVELSPSGKGVHLITKGKAPHNGKRTVGGKTIEVYSIERFFTVTGVAL